MRVCVGCGQEGSVGLVGRRVHCVRLKSLKAGEAVKARVDNTIIAPHKKLKNRGCGILIRIWGMYLRSQENKICDFPLVH